MRCVFLNWNFKSGLSGSGTVANRVATWSRRHRDQQRPDPAHAKGGLFFSWESGRDFAFVNAAGLGRRGKTAQLITSKRRGKFIPFLRWRLPMLHRVKLRRRPALHPDKIGILRSSLRTILNFGEKSRSKGIFFGVMLVGKHILFRHYCRSS